MTTLRYRADIDGLRAVAVLAVVAYHAGFGVRGGYVGVDVFFVISGFLITSLIAKELDAGSFSLAQFWERRIRRIWPAASAMTLLALGAGWMMMLPPSFLRLAEDALAQVLLFANVRFLHSANYFDGSATLRPLLHTWSLAVEEQFYLAFPPLLMLLWGMGRRRVRLVLVVILGASLALSAWQTAAQPKPAFYLLPARVWELMLGALLVLSPRVLGAAKWTRNAAGVGGLGLILAPMLIYSDSTRFPGLAALPPCIGTALLIAAGGPGESSVVTRMLAWTPLRFIGLISYSLYLWHWPILSFMHYTLGDDLTPSLRAAAMAACLLLSIASWRFIEMPVRHVGGRVGLARVAIVAAAATSITVAACLGIKWSGGIPSRFTAAELSLGVPDPMNRSWEATGVRAALERGEAPFKAMGAPRDPGQRPCFLLWGDSHAMAISEALDARAREKGLSGTAALRAESVALPAVWIPALGLESRDASANWNNAVIAWIRENRPANVVLCSRWSAYLEEPPGGRANRLIAPLSSDSPSAALAERTMGAALEALSTACAQSDSTLWLLKEVPTQSDTTERRVAFSHLTGRSTSLAGISLAEHRDHQRRVDALLASLAVPPRVVDLSAASFPAASASRLGEDEASYYADTHHLNTRGVNATAGAILNQLVEAMSRACTSSPPTRPAP